MKSLWRYIQECEGVGSGDAMNVSVQDQKPDPYMPPYSGRKKKFSKLLRGFKNVIKEELSEFMKLWNLKGWFYHEFKPVVGEVHSAEEFESAMIDALFHPDVELSSDSSKVSYKNAEEEIELLRTSLSKEPLSSLLGGHGWPLKFEENILNGKRLGSGCGFKYGEHYPEDFVDSYLTEAVSWQVFLDEAPVTTLDNRLVLIKSLIYSSEQASGLLKQGDQLLKCVWNSSGKCIQKRTEDDMQDLEITDDDSLKIKF